ncbi:DUF3168 domain-containing protein [Sphingobium sp. AR-3-1]|uniref:DUF3168 domain-containing protein n=1 Tax=Sphingobium psychrophilum TaxID=2728834 RepID=A0A7X9ZT65_9SPHN|nr:DUF3168 domain-containing protein [Sphingobium psychrophilum]NML11302.1 DUF3168 domain-containing protein [Sphingobium psychrophilum]
MPTNLDLTQAIRGKILAALKADTDLSAVVAGRIYPQAVPATLTYPYIKIGSPITTPQFIDGGDGCDYSAAIHCFTKKKGGALPPEEMAMAINAHVVRILNAIEVSEIGDSLTLDIFPRQAQTMLDGDADSFHGFVTFDASAS